MSRRFAASLHCQPLACAGGAQLAAVRALPACQRRTRTGRKRPVERALTAHQIANRYLASINHTDRASSVR